jgi:hypothetical protein
VHVSWSCVNLEIVVPMAEQHRGDGGRAVCGVEVVPNREVDLC